MVLCDRGIARPCRLSLQVRIDHHAYKIPEFDSGTPTELLPGLRSVAQKNVNLRGSVIARIDFNILLPVEIHIAKCFAEKVSHGICLAGRDDVIVRLVLLQHEPHGFHVIYGVAPVSLRVQISEK